MSDTMWKLPSRAVIRIALLERGTTVSEWSRREGFSAGLTHKVIARYAGRAVRPDRTWGETRRILLALSRIDRIRGAA